MPLENLVLGRICLHEVHRRLDDKSMAPPTYASGLLTLDAKAKNAFVSRVIAAFKSGAQSMEMTIRSSEVGTAIHTGATLVATTNDQGFVDQSKRLADLLADAQHSRQIPGGLVVAFDGTVGHPSRPFFGVMKAELHEGFLKTANLQARFVDDLFLSPKTKLYKIGFFEQRAIGKNFPEGWTATVYDSAMTASQRDNAALYFHGRFLGLELPDNSAQRVRQFFEKTKDFIRSAPVSEEERVDLYNSLYTYLKVDKAPTIQITKFAESFLSDDLADSYLARMKAEKFPTGAIEKDLSEVSGSLRVRRLRFPRKITLSGPPEALDQLVNVESVPAEDGGENWTLITVKGALESQE